MNNSVITGYYATTVCLLLVGGEHQRAPSCKYCDL